MKYDIEIVLKKLSLSKFRSSFSLTSKDIEYINNKGWETIKSHAADFVISRLVKIDLKKDGKQTPFRGHPVFIAMHATATCCRGCLNKWYKIPKDRDLNNQEIKFILTLIIKWLKKEVNNSL